MKKLFLAAVIAVFTLSNVNAQEVKFGAKAGLNISSLSGDEFKEYDSRIAPHFGGIVEISISEKFSFQPELIYSMQGVKREEGEAKATFKLDYLNLPLMAKFYVAEGFSIEAGPQVGFLLSGKAKFEAGENSGETDLKDSLKGTDFGLGLGAGYRLESGLSIGARYNIGLSNIADTSKADVENDAEAKNGVFQISIGYFFN